MEAGIGAAAGLLGKLQGEPVGGDDVVAADDARGLDAQDLLEIDAAEGHEGGGGIGQRRPNSALKAGGKCVRR